MDVSPQDLRSHDLHEVFRGYARLDVDELLERAAETIDRFHDRVRDLGERVAVAESEAGRSREVEDTLRRVLVAAQRTADQLTAESREQARERLSKAEARSTAVGRDAEARSTAMLEDAEARSTALLEDAQSSSAATLGDAKARATTMLEDAESHSTAMVREAETRSATLISTSESQASRRAEETTARHRSEIDRLSERREALRSEVQTLSRSRDGFLSRLEAAYRSELEELARRRRILRTSVAGDSPGALDDGAIDNDGPDAVAQDRDPGNRDDEVVVDSGPSPALRAMVGKPTRSPAGQGKGDPAVSGEVRA